MQACAMRPPVFVLKERICDMHEFSRTELLIGADGQEKLSASTVVVFGVGGVGSHCIEALARCGIGHLALVDSDTVSLTNINRQSIAYHSTVGRYKTQVMKERIADINPAAQVDTFETFVLPDNLDPLLDGMGQIDYLIDAIDTVTAKLAIAEYAKKHQIQMCIRDSLRVLCRPRSPFLAAYNRSPCAQVIVDLLRDTGFLSDETVRIGLHPVSYTHLDVYKRQVIKLPGIIHTHRFPLPTLPRTSLP